MHILLERYDLFGILTLNIMFSMLRHVCRCLPGTFAGYWIQFSNFLVIRSVESNVILWFESLMMNNQIVADVAIYRLHKENILRFPQGLQSHTFKPVDTKGIYNSELLLTQQVFCQYKNLMSLN